jgi:hypothetical protein
MREFCLSEELLQCYIDGELSPEKMESAATHIAACVDCARAALEVERENEILMNAFEPELSLSVPSGILRERIETAISHLSAPQRQAVSEANESPIASWLKSLAGLFAFTPQRTMGFASLVALVAFAGIFLAITWQRSDEKFAGAGSGAGNQISSVIKPDSTTTAGGSTEGDVPSEIVKSNGIAKSSKINRRLASSQPKADDKATPSRFLPGERSYLETIASLTDAIELSGEVTTRPELRSEYERNLAVVDNAIATTRRAAKQNPKDPETAEFLYAAYQSKVDMLSAVAGQTQIAQR